MILSSRGIRYSSVIFAVAPMTSHWVISSTVLIWYTPFWPSWSPWCTIHPEIARLCLWFWFTSLTYCFSLAFIRLVIECSTAQIGHFFLQVIDMRYRDMGDILVFLLTIFTCHTPRVFFRAAPLGLSCNLAVLARS